MRRIVLGLLVATIIALTWVAIERLDDDLTAMLPRGDATLTREARYFNELGTIRVLLVEAEAVGGSEAVRPVLQDLIARIAPAGAQATPATEVDGLARTFGVIMRHLPELTTADDLVRLAPRLTEAALRGRLAHVKEQIQQPDDWLLAAMAKQDVLGIASGLLAGQTQPVDGAVAEGPLIWHPDGRHALVRFAVDFPADDIARGRPLLAEIATAAESARQRGVTLRWGGSYRHYVENADTVADDLLATFPVVVVLIGMVLWSLVLSWRALAAIHLPVVGGCCGVLAGAGAWSLATGQAVPIGMLGFSAGILGIAVDYGTHTVAAAQEGHRPTRQLTLGFLSSAAAFGCLLWCSVPALQCLGAMILGGLSLALAGALAIPRIPPPRGRVIWLGLGQRMHALLTGRRRTMLVIASLLTLFSVPGLPRLRVESELRSYDGSTPAAWSTLDGIMVRWGIARGVTFVVGEGADLDRALRTVAETRAQLGLAAGTLERFLPDTGEQARRRDGWNAFWTQHADLPQRFAAACGATGLRAEAFASGMAAYAPVTGTRPPVNIDIWHGTPLAPLLGHMVQETADGWQASSPLPAEDVAVHSAISRLPTDAPGWIADRTDLGLRIIQSIKRDLLTMAPLIALAVVVTVGLAVRNLSTMAALLLPPVLAVVWTFGAQGWMGMALTPFSLLAVTFILGIGIDSAVFLHSGPSTMPAVLVAWLTTVVGTTALLMAHHPVIWSLGVMLSLGMTAACIASLLISPTLRRSSGQT